MILFNKFLNQKTILVNVSKITFIKRFYPGKPKPGHARKGLELLNNKPPQVLPEITSSSLPKNLPYESNFIQQPTPTSAALVQSTKAAENGIKNAIKHHTFQEQQPQTLPTQSPITEANWYQIKATSQGNQQVETSHDRLMKHLNFPIKKSVEASVDHLSDLGEDHFLNTTQGSLLITTPSQSTPVPKPLPEIPQITSLDDSQGYNKSLQTNKDVQFLLQHKMLTYENYQEKLTKLFFEFYNKKNLVTDLQYTVDNVEFNNNLFGVGLLKVLGNPMFLSAEQNHVNIIYYAKKDFYIAWGYFTSENNNNLLLSKTQPFSGLNKPQKLTVIQPFIVPKENLLQLPSKEQQCIGETYIKDAIIVEKLKQTFIDNIKPLLKNNLFVYDGRGITEEEVKAVIIMFEEKQKKHAIKYFSKYRDIAHRPPDNIQAWLQNLEQKAPFYPYLKNLIDEYKKKSK